MQTDIEVTVNTEVKKDISNPYMKSIVAMSIVSFFSYFYANSLAPILSILAEEFHYTDIERDRLLGKSYLLGVMCRKLVKHYLLLIGMSFIFTVFLHW